MRSTLSFFAALFALAGCTAAVVSTADREPGPYGKADRYSGAITCPDRQPEVRREVQTLIDAITAGTRTDITSADAFVGALPEDVRKNMVVLTDTRAAQRNNTFAAEQRLVTEPQGARTKLFHGDTWCTSNSAGTELGCIQARVLIQSTEGDVIASIVTDPDSPSRQSVELAMFDPTTSSLTLFDARFPNGTATIERNPDACATCHTGHDGQINWRMDPYRFWDGVTPFAEDFIRAGSVEAEWYISFLKRIEGGEDVLRHLRPINTRAQIEAAMTAGRGFEVATSAAQVNFSGRNTPGLNLSHQLLEKNGCRVAAALASRDDFSRIQYAAAGALNDCANIADFFPAEGTFTQAVADEHFTDRGLEKGTGTMLEALRLRAVARQTRMQSDRLSRRFDHFAEFAGDTAALAELQGAIAQDPSNNGAQYGLANFEIGASAITKAQYLLEPLGVDVTNWSMAVDPENQSHVEFFDQINRRFRPIVGQEMDRSCERLAELSREALRDYMPQQTGARVDPAGTIEADALAMSQARTLAELTTSAGEIYANRCVHCHEGGSDGADFALGTPYFPMRTMTQMNEVIGRERTSVANMLRDRQLSSGSRQYAFEYVTLGDRIWDRVTRHPLNYGMMPADDDPMPREDKVVLRAHMLAVWASTP